MSIDQSGAPRPLPDRPNLRHLKDQARDLLRTGAAASVTDAQFKIARLYGFASWPKLKAHVDSLEEVGKLKHAIDGNDPRGVLDVYREFADEPRLTAVWAETRRGAGVPLIERNPLPMTWRPDREDAEAIAAELRAAVD